MKKKERSFLLVDGYNIIYSWNELKELAGFSLESARDKLIDILCDYGGYVSQEIIVVFDAHKVKGGVGSQFRHNNIFVVYTKEAETADHFIEKTVSQIIRNYNVSVATSDYLEQIIIIAEGAIRLSAKDLWENILAVRERMGKPFLEKMPKKENLLFDNVSPEIAEILETLRRG